MRCKTSISSALFLTIIPSFTTILKIIHTWTLVIFDMRKSPTENKFGVKIPKENTSVMKRVSNFLNALLDLFSYSGEKTSLVILVAPFKTFAAVKILKTE